MSKNVYGVSQINRYIKNMFAQDFMLHHLCVKGEVSNCKYHSSGHIYFTLKENGSAMKAVMFLRDRGGLRFQMKDGDQVHVTGAVQVFERDGTYQMYAKEVSLAGAGDLYQRFEQLKRELEEMGMFAAQYKQPIPKYATKIGVVTAPTGAAIQDIRNVAGRRNPYVQILLYPAQVQGEGAVDSIVNGIRALDVLGLDVLIVGRGGGSIEDLWAFNDEAVARAVFDCRTPVISAVGHETDTTIIDYVADLRAPTPSAAAELAVFDYDKFMEDLTFRRLQLRHLMKGHLDRSKSRVEMLEARLQQQSPGNQLNEKSQHAADLQLRLEHRIQELIGQRRTRLQLFAQRMEDLSPLKKLGHGYVYVRTSEQAALSSVEQVKTGDRLQAVLPDGSLTLAVEEIRDGNGGSHT